MAIAGLLAALAGPTAYATSAATSQTNGTNPLAGPSTGGFGRGGPGGRGGAGMPGGGMPPAAARKLMQEGRLPGGPGGGGPGGGGPGGGGPGMGEASSQLTTYLKTHRDGATWLVAVSNAQSASSIILKTGLPVIAMGGFTGSDPAMTVTKLQEYVRAGKLHDVLTGGGGPGGGGDSSVTSWVTKNCTAVKTSEYTSGSTTTQNTQALYRCG